VWYIWFFWFCWANERSCKLAKFPSCREWRYTSSGARSIAKNVRLELAATNGSDLSIDSAVPETIDGDGKAFGQPTSTAQFTSAIEKWGRYLGPQITM
jgi:hypothetical protein